MKILNLNQFNEKLKVNHISLSDLENIEVEPSSIDSIIKANEALPIKLGRYVYELYDKIHPCLYFNKIENYDDEYYATGYKQNEDNPMIFISNDVDQRTGDINEYYIEIPIDNESSIFASDYCGMDDLGGLHPDIALTNSQKKKLENIGIYPVFDEFGYLQIGDSELFAKYFNKKLNPSIGIANSYDRDYTDLSVWITIPVSDKHLSYELIDNGISFGLSNLGLKHIKKEFIKNIDFCFNYIKTELVKIFENK